jgi:hypothetical protein
MRRLGTVVVLAASLGLAAAQPAGGYYVWEDRELVDKIRFSGESDECDYGETPGYSHDDHRQAIPGPAKAVRVVSPSDGQSLRLDGSKSVVIGSITDVLVSATTPYDQVVHIMARGHYPACLPWKKKWKSELVEMRIEYKQRVYTATPPVVSCPEPWQNISRLRAQRTTCFYATSVARRYLSRLGRATRRYIAPYTCLDTVIAEGRKVACRAPGARYVWFRYERPAVRPPVPPARP